MVGNDTIRRTAYLRRCIFGILRLPVPHIFRFRLVEDDEFFIDLVLMTLSSDNNTIVASKYQLYLPTEQQLIAEVERVRKEWKETK